MDACGGLLGPLCGFLGASFGMSWACRGPLEGFSVASRGLPGVLLAARGGVLEAIWAALGAMMKVLARWPLLVVVASLVEAMLEGSDFKV